MSEPLRDTITEDLADGNGALGAPCSVQDVADLFDTIDRLTAERDAARAEATRLREAIEDYRERLVEAERTLDDHAIATDGGDHSWRLRAKRHGVSLAIDYLRAIALTTPTDVDRALVERVTRHSPTFTEVTPPTDQGDAGT